jgi:hypothetical protein
LSSSCWLGCCFAARAVEAENERTWRSPRRREEDAAGEGSMKMIVGERKERDMSIQTKKESKKERKVMKKCSPYCLAFLT